MKKCIILAIIFTILAILNKIYSQSWTLTEELPSVITDIEFDGEDRYIIYKQGVLTLNNDTLAVFPVNDFSEQGLLSVIKWIDRICVNYSTFESSQIIVCGKSGVFNDTIFEYTFSPPSGNHKGGDMVVIDSTLFVSVGYGSDPKKEGYVFGITDTSTYIYASGLRNTWKLAVEADTMYLADNGVDSFEEINKTWQSGLDFGWPCWESFSLLTIDTCGEVVFPIFSYPHDTIGGNSVIGGVVYQGAYYFADHYHDKGWRITDSLVEAISMPVFVTGMVEHNDTLYAYTFNGDIFRFSESPLGIDSFPPPKLPKEWVDFDCVEYLDRVNGNIWFSENGYYLLRLPIIPGKYWNLRYERWDIVTENRTILRAYPIKKK